jgi:type II secretory pathway component PulK
MKQHKGESTSGAILVLALWVIALLSIMLFGLVTTQRVAIRNEEVAQCEFEGRNLLLTLATYCKTKLAADTNKETDNYGEEWGQLRAWTSQQIFTAAGVSQIKPEDYILKIRPVDECGKININIAPVEVIREAIREAAGDEHIEIANAIVDWRDTDDSGAYEREAYSGKEPPYAPANADFAHTEELLFVAGVTPEIFWGEDANHNGQLDPEEDDGSLYPPNDNSDGRLQVGLTDIFTVYGEGDININCASELVLKAVLQAAISEDEADSLTTKILKARRGKDGVDGTDDDTPFTKPADLISLADPATLLALQNSRISIGVGLTSTAFSFHLAVDFLANHRTLEADCTFHIEGDGIQMVEWRETGMRASRRRLA